MLCDLLTLAILDIVIVLSPSCDFLWPPQTVAHPPRSSVYGISQARILEWVVISFSRGSSQPRDQTEVSCIGGKIFYHWATREAQRYLYYLLIYRMPSSRDSQVGYNSQVSLSLACPRLIWGWRRLHPRENARGVGLSFTPFLST